jgi:hypothetical protein
MIFLDYLALIDSSGFSQALYSLPGSKLNPSDASSWFRIFYRGLDNPIFLPYTDSEVFVNQITFRLADFAADDSTRRLYSIIIRPCFLPVGMSSSNRIIKSGYEFYQPVVAAWQFGLGQVPLHFFLHHLTTSRADLPDNLTSQRCYSLFSDLCLPIPVDFSFTSSAIGFETWWSMWKTHVFWKALGPMLQQIHAEYEAPEEEVLPSVQYLFLTPFKPFSNSISFLCSRRMVRSPRTMMAPPSSSCQLPLWSSSAKNAPPPSKVIMWI